MNNQEDYSWITEVYTIRDADKVMEQSLSELETAIGAILTTIEEMIKDAPTMSLEELDKLIQDNENDT